MSSLSGAWLVIALLSLIAWIGACVLGAGVGPFARRLRAGILVGIAGVALAASLAALAIAVALVSADWAWGAEKLLVAGPIGVVSSVLATWFVARDAVRARRGEPSDRIFLGILISAAIGAAAAPIAVLLIGSEVTWPAALAVVLLWASASAAAVLATAGRPRRSVVASGAFAVFSVALLALFTVFGPTVATAGTGGHHLVVADDPGDASVSVADFRETDLDGDVHAFELEARHETITLPDGSSYDAVDFGSVPGPELVVTEGELVEMTLTNRDVDDGVTLHWHGYDVPSGDDGVAGVTQDAVQTGDSFTYRFAADQVGTYWYHTHQDALSGITRGLYGALIVLPAGSPERDAETDVTALIHSMSDTTLVGAHETLRLTGAAETRLRLANTDQTPRRLVLDADVTVLALDGVDLGAPAPLPAGTTLRIPAGGRADLGIAPGTVASLAIDRAPGSGVAIGRDDVAELSFTGPEFDLLTAGSGPMPAWALDSPDVQAVQVLDRLIRIVNGSPRMADTINAAAFPAIQPIVVDEGDVVVVTIINRGTETHPMHLHGHHMIVLSRDGVAADGPVWLDTVDVRPGETWKVAFVADNPGLWMDHCHNLEHAAAGMVMHLAYRGVTSPFELGGEHGNAPE
jgi:FtsP/CotA-like multicopper oxidase with cupredoxin domain